MVVDFYGAQVNDLSARHGRMGILISDWCCMAQHLPSFKKKKEEIFKQAFFLSLGFREKILSVVC